MHKKTVNNVLRTRDAFNSSILSEKVRQLGSRSPLGCFWGAFGAPFRAQLGSFFQVWFQGGSQGGFWMHFGVLLEVILDGFLMFSESILGVILEPAV